MALNRRSIDNLSTCLADIRLVCEEAAKEIDFVVFKGHKGKGEQDENFAKKLSKLTYPKSKHNCFPSHAIDFYPSPFKGWGDINSFKLVANTIIRKGAKLGIFIIWGGIWKKFPDADHIEFISKNGIAYDKKYRQEG